VGLTAVNIDLGEHWELSSLPDRGVLLDLFFTIWLLTTKLVAWESKDFETLAAELLMELNHFNVVLAGHASLGGDVDDQDAFLTFDKFLE